MYRESMANPLQEKPIYKLQKCSHIHASISSTRICKTYILNRGSASHSLNTFHNRQVNWPRAHYPSQVTTLRNRATNPGNDMNLLAGMSFEYILVATLVMMVAGLVHGTLGLGFPMVATPLLALVLDVRLAILITLIPTAVVNLASIFGASDWRSVLSNYWRIPLYALIGGFFGSWLIDRYDPAPFQLLLALLIFLYLACARFKPEAFRFLASNSNLTMPIVGLVAGFAAGTTNVMVPILIIYTLSLALTKDRMVQLFNTCFLAGKIAQLIVFSASGTVTPAFLLATLPFAIVGYLALLAGKRIRDQLPTALFMKIVRAILFLLGVLLIVQVFLQ